MSGGQNEAKQGQKIRKIHEEIDQKLDLLFSLADIGKRKSLAKKKIEQLQDKLNNYG